MNRILFLFVLVGTCLFSPPVLADTAEGAQALERGDYEIGLQILNREAEKGDPQALFYLAQAYEYGYGVTPNIFVAARLYAQSAGLGHVDANLRLGKMNLMGDGLPRDAARASNLFAFAARAGNPEATYLLAVQYLDGEGVPKDTTQGLTLLQLAADRLYPAALNHLATFYVTGEAGIERHLGRGYELFHMAAARGSGDAMFNLGQAYLRGQGLPEDALQAYLWLGLALGYGNPAIQTEADRLRREAAQRLPASVQAEIDERIRVWKPTQ